MSIETTLAELIAALNANTEAIKAQGIPVSAAAPATRAPRGSKAAVKEEAPAPAAEPTPEPANVTPITPPAAKEGAVTANMLKKFVKDERTRLAEVSGEAVKKHKEESAKILKSFGLVDFTSIPDNVVADMFAAFKAVNVEKQDGLDDDLDDNDGL